MRARLPELGCLLNRGETTVKNGPDALEMGCLFMLPIGATSSSATVERSSPTSTSPPITIALTTRLSDGWSAASSAGATAMALAPLKRDEIGMNRHRALGYCLSMIFSENRFALFRIML
jgi:hypothetical protein